MGLEENEGEGGESGRGVVVDSQAPLPTPGGVVRAVAATAAWGANRTRSQEADCSRAGSKNATQRAEEAG
eukprot:3571745-Pyramimonas_sp.AAC.1